MISTIERTGRRATYTANEGRDESHASLRTSDGLSEAKQESEVAMDLVVALEFTGSLNALPGRGDLDQDTVLGDPDGLVQSNQLLGLIPG